MPSWFLHEYFDKLLTGKKHRDVHMFLDLPGVLLNNGYVKGHRSKWGHSIEYAILVYLLSNGDIDKTISALGHLVLDEIVSYDKGKEIEAIIKLLRLLRR